MRRGGFASLCWSRRLVSSGSLRSWFRRRTVLDSLIDEAAEIFKEYYQIEEFGDPTVQSQVRPFLTCAKRG